MGDHAPASETKTRCDRKIRVVPFANIEMLEMKNLYGSKVEYGLTVRSGWKMGDDAPTSEARTRWGRRIWDVQSIFTCIYISKRLKCKICIYRNLSMA